MISQQNITERKVIIFASVKGQDITEHYCNMALAISRYMDLLVVYDKKREADNKRLDNFHAHDIECIDISELERVIKTRFNKISLLFHCHGFYHLRLAKKFMRSIDKIMMSVHCFRHALWYAKGFAILTYFLFSSSVDMWHFLSYKSRDEYFWFRNIPSNTCVYPLGLERLFMSKTAELCIVKDLNGEEIIDLPNRINIVCIAQLQPWKRHLFLLRSLQSILKGNTYLYLLGEGPLLKKIMAFATKSGIRNNVVFTGKVDRKTVYYILSHAKLSVTVAPSETFGWCLLEPFCMDVPIVTTNVGIANSVIHDFYNGFILNKNCTEGNFLEKTILALKYLRKIDNSESKRLFLWETFAKASVNCYEFLLENMKQSQQ